MSNGSYIEDSAADTLVTCGEGAVVATQIRASIRLFGKSFRETFKVSSMSNVQQYTNKYGFIVQGILGAPFLEKNSMVLDFKTKKIYHEV